MANPTPNLTSNCGIQDYLNADIPQLCLIPKAAYEGLRNAAVLHLSNALASKCAFDELEIDGEVCSQGKVVERITRVVAELERLLSNTCKATPAAVQHVGDACNGGHCCRQRGYY
jgi:hypothetical protein